MSNRPVTGPPSAAEVERIVRQQLSNIGAGNLAKRAVGIGTPAAGSFAGAHNAQWQAIKLSGSQSYYDIPHTLGGKPVHVELMYVEDTTGAASTPPHAHAAPIQHDQWTGTNARVHVSTLAGGLDNCIGWFLVRGA
jgi:hypothetical protein